MNKQELIKKYEDEFSSIGMNLSTAIKFKELWIDILKLDEPQKPVVQQFVADWYEENKDDFETNLFRAVDLIPSDYEEGDLSEFEEWLVENHTEPFQTLVNMHQFGYTIEKEKRYVVSLKNGQPLVKSQSGSALYFSQDITAGNYKVTLKELEEAGFGWVFDCPGIEIEEVEE